MTKDEIEAMADRASGPGGLANGSVRLEDFSPSGVARPATLVDFMTYTLEETLGSTAIIQVETRDGRVRSARTEMTPSGGAVSMTENGLIRKFMDCAKFAARPVDAERWVEKVLDLETQRDIAPLLTD